MPGQEFLHLVNGHLVVNELLLRQPSEELGWGVAIHHRAVREVDASSHLPKIRRSTYEVWMYPCGLIVVQSISVPLLTLM